MSELAQKLSLICKLQCIKCKSFDVPILKFFASQCQCAVMSFTRDRSKMTFHVAFLDHV